MILTQAEFDALMRVDFQVFVEKAFAELNASAVYLDNFHIGVIAAKLEAVRRGEITRLIINVPPRSLKSIIASVAFPAYVLGHNPCAKIIAASYGQDLAQDLARDSRQIMQAPWFQRTFARSRLSAERYAVNSFETTAGGLRMATSVGGALTGFGADIIVIDDPVKPDQALSDVERAKVNQWYNHTLLTRLNSKSKGAIVVVMQRLHEDDFVGHIKQLDDWEIVSFPAIAQHDEVHRIKTPHGSYTHRRAEGEALHPAREPLAVLERIRRTIGSAYFAAQYLQSPMPPGGGLIKEAWFVRFDLDLPPNFDRILQSWDTANKVNELNDFSVCVTLGIKGKHVYLVDVLRKQLEYPDLKRAVKEQSNRFGAKLVLIEDRASGVQLIQDLRQEGVYNLKAVSPKGDKILRMRDQTAMMEGGFVHLPERAPWLDDLMAELMVFPKGRHDDQADALSQALRWVSDESANGGFIQLVEKANALREDKVEGALRMRSPSNRGPLLGIHLIDDFIYRVAPEDVGYYLERHWRVID